MPEIITMPALSPTMTEGKLVSWKIQEGDIITSGQILADIETDKAIMELESLDSGIMYKILYQAGETSVRVGVPLAILRLEDDTEDDLQNIQNKIKTTEQTKQPIIEETKQPMITGCGQQASLEHSKRVKASPLASRTASSHGINLVNISQGSGPHGRIIQKDVEEFLNRKQSVTVSEAGSTTLIPLTGMRKTIADRLSQSKREVPHFYVSVDVEVDALSKMREKLNAHLANSHRVTLSFNDMIVKAVSMALIQNPNVNVCWEGSSGIRQYFSADIAVAVSVEGGIYTPVLCQTEKMNLQRLSSELRILINQAKEKTLKPEQYTGGSFTISNMGMYGTKEFYAIINQPHGSILAVGGIRKIAGISETGEIVPQSIMTLNLSADHRVIDGADAARFMQDLKKILENPEFLAL